VLKGTRVLRGFRVRKDYPVTPVLRVYKEYKGRRAIPE